MRAPQRPFSVLLLLATAGEAFQARKADRHALTRFPGVPPRASARAAADSDGDPFDFSGPKPQDLGSAEDDMVSLEASLSRSLASRMEQLGLDPAAERAAASALSE